MEQGNVLRPPTVEQCWVGIYRLNPFGTGQCLTTNGQPAMFKINVSQSLWNRAMSYDLKSIFHLRTVERSQSLWNRAMSYDTNQKFTTGTLPTSQSLWNRAMSYDVKQLKCLAEHELSQSLWNRAMSYDFQALVKFLDELRSQSLWNRAMSYDEIQQVTLDQLQVSIPLEQGNVLRHRTT